MRIESLAISNFRGIERLEAADLGDTIIVAGQNGSGKSCIFDAIRLLKSTYGGYQQNEWQQFFGEFQIQLHGNARNLRGLFNNQQKPVVIECVFKLRDRERAYVSQNLKELLEQTIWQAVLPEAFQFGGYAKALFSAQFRDRQPEVAARLQEELPTLQNELAQPHSVSRIDIFPNGEVNTRKSRLLEVIFSNYRPRKLGVIDFHGAQRHYGRELVQGINLNLDHKDQQYSQHSLYNYNNKYANVKSEMASNFIKEILAENAEGASLEDGSSSLIETLKELFESFFPDKRFLGPRPTKDGSLEFPVITQSGTEHDLDELSSGEKEILYGYLRIRSSAPRDSIILLDEPELHLNPRLIRGLPEFYRRHLGEALQNQLWLVTHSDALIREAVGKPGFNVFHMLPCGAEGADSSQLRPLSVTRDLDVVLADLVGDLAAYRPGGKGLIFEGGGDSDFDKSFVAALFSEELRGINLISGTNKMRVRVLHEVLEAAYNAGDFPTKFFAVVDGDYEHEPEQNPAVNTYAWDVYHVENYLLDPKIVADVMNSIVGRANYTTETVLQKLNVAARAVVPAMVVEKMRSYANTKIIRNINLSFDNNAPDISGALRSAIDRSFERLANTVRTDLTADILADYEAQLRSEVEECFADGTWMTKLPGRDILRQFVVTERLKISYEVLRNLIKGRMADQGVKPVGMKKVIDAICRDVP